MSRVMDKEEIAKKIQFMDEFLKDKTTLGTTLGIESIEVHPKCMRAKMPVNDRTKQPFGILHGGSSVALAESLASIGSCLYIDVETQRAVGVSITANHINMAMDGWVYGTATPIHIGRKTHVWNIDITNEGGKLISTCRCTTMIISLPKK